METKFKMTIFHFLATFGSVMLLTPFAHAATFTPLDCPGVVVVQGGYRLTQDTTCASGFNWQENNKFFSLNGFTLRTASISVQGTGLTIRNGVLQTNGMDWAFSNKGTLSNLMVKNIGTPRGFFIEAGSNFTVKNSIFANIPGVVLDFYFGDGGTVRNSKFIRNGTAISIQKSNGVLIEHNKFIGNNRGVNLWDEINGGVNKNKIRYSIFQKNEVGINILALPPVSFPAMERNQIVGNNISRSSHSGLFIQVACEISNPPMQPICPAQHTKVSGNRLNHNGFGSFTGTPDDDGVSARATQWGTNIPYPDGLVGVTLSNNRADRNADLGFDVEGVTDGGGQIAEFNENPAQCDGLVCNNRVGKSLTVWRRDAIYDTPLVFGDQLRHTQ
jgi:Right handed beta helix region